MAGKTFPAFPVHAQPVISRIWQEAHCTIIFLRTWQKLQYRITILHPKPNLYAQRGYSTREFQALQMIVLVLFDTIDYPVAPCMLVYSLKISFKRHLVCKVNIMENNFFHCFQFAFVYVFAYILIYTLGKKGCYTPIEDIKTNVDRTFVFPLGWNWHDMDPWLFPNEIRHYLGQTFNARSSGIVELRNHSIGGCSPNQSSHCDNFESIFAYFFKSFSDCSNAPSNPYGY